MISYGMLITLSNAVGLVMQIPPLVCNNNMLFTSSI